MLMPCGDVSLHDGMPWPVCPCSQHWYHKFGACDLRLVAPAASPALNWSHDRVINGCCWGCRCCGGQARSRGSLRSGWTCHT